MEQPGSVDGLETSAYEDEFTEGLDGADEMADPDAFTGAPSSGDEEFAAEDLAADVEDSADIDLMASEEDSGGGVQGNAWDAFQDELADALVEEDGDEFLGRILGGLSRAARTVAPAARRAMPQMMRAARGIAGQAGGLSQAAQRLAQTLGSPGAQGGAAPAAGGGIAALLGQLMGQGFDEFEAFDELADAYEEGVDEALPAIVGLAARGLARGLGHRTVGQLGHAARRALVRGVATATRTLVNQHGPRGARAAGRLAVRTGRAARRGATSPQHAAQRVARTLPRAAQRVARQGRVVRQLAQPMTARTPGVPSPSRVAPKVRPPLGTAGPGAPAETMRALPPATRVLRLRGPVEIVIRQR